MLTQAQKKAAELYRWEDSSLRQVWRITQLLMKIKKVGKHQAISKIEDDPSKLMKTRDRKSDTRDHPGEFMKANDLH